MDDWIRSGLRTDPITTIGRMLRRGIIAFESPTEFVYSMDDCSDRNTGRYPEGQGVPCTPRTTRCGSCLRAASFGVRNTRVRLYMEIGMCVRCHTFYFKRCPKCQELNRTVFQLVKEAADRTLDKTIGEIYK